MHFIIKLANLFFPLIVWVTNWRGFRLLRRTRSDWGDRTKWLEKVRLIGRSRWILICKWRWLFRNVKIWWSLLIFRGSFCMTSSEQGQKKFFFSFRCFVGLRRLRWIYFNSDYRLCWSWWCWTRFENWFKNVKRWGAIFAFTPNCSNRMLAVTVDRPAAYNYFDLFFLIISIIVWRVPGRSPIIYSRVTSSFRSITLLQFI